MLCLPLCRLLCRLFPRFLSRDAAALSVAPSVASSLTFGCFIAFSGDMTTLCLPLYRFICRLFRHLLFRDDAAFSIAVSVAWLLSFGCFVTFFVAIFRLLLRFSWRDDDALSAALTVTLTFTGQLCTVPIQDVVQGNGAAPQIWAVVSTPVLNMLRHEGHGAYFGTAITGTTISFVVYAFIHDTGMRIISQNPNDAEADVALRKQQAFNFWEGSNRATGGAIVPEKSHWYLIDF
jgi:hypothetical protein